MNCGEHGGLTAKAMKPPEGGFVNGVDKGRAESAVLAQQYWRFGSAMVEKGIFVCMFRRCLVQKVLAAASVVVL